jgi:AraC-like DNA-binding protein
MVDRPESSTGEFTTALATRLLYLGRSAKQPESETVSALPHRTLRRVLDRMQSGIHADPDFKTLAAEAGYSQSHFLRMFRAATGTTPHPSARPETGEGQGTARHGKDSINRRRGRLRLLQPLASVNRVPQPLRCNTKWRCSRVKSEIPKSLERYFPIGVMECLED